MRSEWKGKQKAAMIHPNTLNEIAAAYEERLAAMREQLAECRRNTLLEAAEWFIASNSTKWTTDEPTQEFAITMCEGIAKTLRRMAEE